MTVYLFSVCMYMWLCEGKGGKGDGDGEQAK